MSLNVFSLGTRLIKKATNAFLLACANSITPLMLHFLKIKHSFSILQFKENWDWSALFELCSPHSSPSNLPELIPKNHQIQRIHILK